MELPEDFDGGPMSDTEFQQLKADEEAEAHRHGYVVSVERVVQDGQIFAHVKYSQPAAAAGESGAGTAAVVTAAAVAAGVGAAVGGPVMAAGAAAVATAVVGKMTSGGTPSPRQAIANALKDAADTFQVDPKLLAAIAFVESSLDPGIKNPKSTAFGLFQFIDATWASVVGQHGAAVSVKVSDRKDPRAQCMMGAAFLKDNRDLLARRLSRVPSHGDCYAAHFLGAGTAARLLSGPGGESSADALGTQAQQVIDANPDIFKQGGAIRTVDQVMAELARRVEHASEKAEQLLNTA